jgi:hypothetical protein
MPAMNAHALVRRKEVRADGSIVEVVVWQVAEPLAPCEHHYKYRLAYVENGRCVVRYDNELGKGDHRHIDGVENEYRFLSLAQLLADFRDDVENRQ